MGKDPFENYPYVSEGTFKRDAGERPTHEQMLDAVAQSEAAWRVVRDHYWRGKNIREAVRLAYEEMSAIQ